jgi:predicted O-linked N-acetylglucosamine transferase (SPINDLY family)
MSAHELADAIRRDRIDILVDLTGHTGGNRLATLALRPAPVQVTYMGYPNTTGLSAIDYRIVDVVTDPAPLADRLATEKLARLDPCFLCYAPPAQAPAVAPPPCARAGHVTFGSFNTHAKTSPPCAEAWARILEGVPGSRLLLKNWALADSSIVDRTRRLFAERGIDPERLDLRGETESKGEHLRTYAEVDVALDPFPYNGTTTTMEAMWMGVPVITLRGETHVARVGASLLTAVGEHDHVAGTIDEYARAAIEMAGDAVRLGSTRAARRDRVRSSPLCDGPGFTLKIESLYRRFWKDRVGR